MTTTKRLAAALAAVIASSAGCGSTKESSVTDDQKRGRSDVEESSGDSERAGDRSHEAVFREYFGDALDGLEVKEFETKRVGGWRFFNARRKHPGRHSGVHAAVHDSGMLIVPGKKLEDLHHFLASDEVDAATALARLAWLFGDMPLEAGASDLEEGSAELVEDPELVREEDGTMRLVGWYATPPEVDTPWRITVSAPPSGAPAIETAPWHEVAEERE